jgi:hypothetical protein
MKANKSTPANRYSALIEKIFFDAYKKGATSLEFERPALKKAAAELKLVLPENLGDVIYSMRFRAPMPASVIKTQTPGSEWIIELAGRAKYRFRLVPKNRIVPNPSLTVTKIPDNTPEIIAAYALDDEQALLAKVRYNRLIDLFLGLTTYSLQNHLRTTVKNIGQIEIDELYVGMDKFGAHYTIPVQAKGGTDKISIVQTVQDISWCKSKFPSLRCRPISVQFISSSEIAVFELTIESEEVRVVDERHYRLVPASELDASEISTYRHL